MDNERRFYTYAWLREGGTPYYIGKGSGNRCYVNAGRGVSAPPRERILLLKTGLTEKEAFRHEIYMIAIYGRKDLGTGILWNFTDGGEGVGGAKVSEETRQKISQSSRGKPKSPEHRANLSRSLKGRKLWLGKNHTETAKAKMSATKKEKRVGIGRVWFHLPEENRECHFAPDALPSAPWVRGRLKRKVR
jgi:hypothetical protein